MYTTEKRRKNNSGGEVTIYLRNQDPVSSSAAHGHAVAVPSEGAGADGQDLGFVEVLDTRLRQEDAAGCLGLGLDALDQHAVEQRDEGLDGADSGGLEMPQSGPG